MSVEFEDYEYVNVASDVVVLAGDIHTKDRGLKQAIEDIKVKPVVYIPGNHEFYGKAQPKLTDELKKPAV